MESERVDFAETVYLGGGTLDRRAWVLSELIFFMDRSMTESVVWGQRDCATWAANWWRMATGHDPAGAFRGMYESRDEAWAIVDAAGGFLPLMARQMADVGATATTEPRDGDIGVADLPRSLAQRGPVCAIRFSGIWYFKAEHGVFAAELPTLTAWRLP